MCPHHLRSHVPGQHWHRLLAKAAVRAELDALASAGAVPLVVYAAVEEARHILLLLASLHAAVPGLAEDIAVLLVEEVDSFVGACRCSEEAGMRAGLLATAVEDSAGLARGNRSGLEEVDNTVLTSCNLFEVTIYVETIRRSRLP